MAKSLQFEICINQFYCTKHEYNYNTISNNDGQEGKSPSKYTFMRNQCITTFPSSAASNSFMIQIMHVQCKFVCVKD